MRRVRIAVVGLLLAAALAPAQAQINPFRAGRYGGDMPPGDWAALLKSVDELNADPTLKVGDSDSWNNPDTGGFGTNTVQRLFTQNGMPCRRLEHVLATKSQSRATSFVMSWCKTSQGAWKTVG
jgi:hypothetical protein